MKWLFAIKEKLVEVYEAVRKNAWYAIPGLGWIYSIHWVLVEWLPARALQVMDDVQAKLPALDVNLGGVNIAWERINQWVPLNEAMVWGGIYISLAMSLAALRWVRKFLPI